MKPVEEEAPEEIIGISILTRWWQARVRLGAVHGDSPFVGRYQGSEGAMGTKRRASLVCAQHSHVILGETKHRSTLTSGVMHRGESGGGCAVGCQAPGGRSPCLRRLGRLE